MKRLLIAGAVLVGALGFQLRAADPIDSKVIHDYTFIGAGYGYLHELTDDLNGHGLTGFASFEEHNVVIGISGGHFWGDDDLGDADVTLWDIGGSLGYVVRLVDNHVNIIPRVGLRYGEVELNSHKAGDSWAVAPGVFASYAINNRLAINGSYAWAFDVENDDDAHAFSVGGQIAVLERVGVNLSASFVESIGFAGITAGVELHF
jgi:hypothetical protein